MHVLFISYAFPPVGGAGVQRVLKLVKYLARAGVVPSVLTVKAPSVPVFDASLERDVPAGVEVLRARTLEPRYAKKRLAWKVTAEASDRLSACISKRVLAVVRSLLVPDPQVLWVPAAGWTLGRRLLSAPVDVVFISGPPFSQFLLAALVRLRPGTALVLDYRDEWTTTGSAYEMSSSAKAGALLERLVLRSCHAITTATDEFRTALLGRFPFLDSERVRAIPNGYDPEDFPTELPSPSGARFALTYAGTVFRLTSARGFIAGLRLFHAREPELAGLLDVRFVGRIVETEAVYFEGTEAIGVRLLGYLEHVRAVEELARSHAALCILDDVSGVERIYPAKIFEIMRLRRPCLALTPEGALASLVRRHQVGQVVAPRDTEAIASALARMVREFRDHAPATWGGPVDTERFDRRRQALEFADTFRAALADARGAT